MLWLELEDVLRRLNSLVRRLQLQRKLRQKEMGFNEVRGNIAGLQQRCLGLFWLFVFDIRLAEIIMGQRKSRRRFDDTLQQGDRLGNLPLRQYDAGFVILSEDLTVTMRAQLLRILHGLVEVLLADREFCEFLLRRGCVRL